MGSQPFYIDAGGSACRHHLSGRVCLYSHYDREVWQKQIDLDF